MVCVNGSCGSSSSFYNSNSTPPPIVSPSLGKWDKLCIDEYKSELFGWTELKPFKKGDPADWGHRYVFEFCSRAEDWPRIAGDHTWFRLKTPEGDIYSIGLYPICPPNKVFKLSYLAAPLRTQKGRLMSPDVNEFNEGEAYRTFSFAITPDQFQQMKARIEEDRNNDHLLYQLGHLNCATYSKRVASVAGIELPTALPIMRLITPTPLYTVAETLALFIPEIVKRITKVVFAVFVNLTSSLLGATRVDKEVQGTVEYPVPAHINSFWDLFSPEKAMVQHPYLLANPIRIEVQEWRKERIATLEKDYASLREQHSLVNPADLSRREQIERDLKRIEKEIDDTRYDLPKKFRTGEVATEPMDPSIEKEVMALAFGV